MQCNSCKEDIPAKFVKAISINSCPICGGQIVDPVVKTILNELEIVLNKAKEHMDQIEDWLFTNFQLRKMRENEVVIDKNELPIAEPERPQGRVGRGAAVHRTGDGDEASTNPKRVQSAIDFIKGKGTGLADPSLYVGEDDEGNKVDLSADLEAKGGLNSSEVNQMQNLFGNGIQTDPKEDAQNASMMQKLRRLQR